MTENRPIITYSGDVGVFESVAPSLLKGLGAEAVEWKRAYGRTTKHVHLHPKFLPFQPPPPLQEKGEGETTNGPTTPLNSLLDQPMLHTFWTDCSDVEVYRTSTKEAIQTWLNSVKSSCTVKEWLIVSVEPPNNKRANKLLPRTSVLDKVRNDFAQKQTERCVGLSDPQKIDSKSAESLNAMLHRIRQLLLASYSKTLTKFEESMRAQREKRVESGWNFCHYFLLQEELAFVLEMLQVYDEALVQYDELDALFTQFVLNSHFTDTPMWLLSFQRYGDRWPALALSSTSGAHKILPKIRDHIGKSAVSLLNFRNYLFARQAILLVKQKRLNELAQRALSFLHNCINELGILDVNFTEEGAISCWVFVSSLEILGTISSENLLHLEHHQEKENLVNDHLKLGHHGSASDFSVHTASLWDYAREKLYELGRLCGLLPTSELKSDHLHKVISLAAGLIPFEGFPNGSSKEEGKEGEGKEEGVSAESRWPHVAECPVEKMKNSLSSKESFQQSYLELCELAMGTYKHIGRLRSARKVGLSLASYYMEGGEWTKAIVFLTEAYNTFKQDRWTALTVDVLLKLAKCYQAVGDVDRYVRTCAQIACSTSVGEEERSHYFDEMMSALTGNESEKKERLVLSHLEETFRLHSVEVKTKGKIHGKSCPLEVVLQVESNFPRPVCSSSVQMAIIPCDHEPRVGAPVQIQGDSGKFGKPLKHSPSTKSSKSNNEDPAAADANAANKAMLTRKESVTPILTCEDEDIALAQMDANPAINMMDIRQQFDGVTKPAAAGHEIGSAREKYVMGKLTCHNPHQTLRRKDSSQVVGGEKQASKTDFTEAASTTDIILNPGRNEVVLSAEVGKAGSFRLAQISISLKHLELLSPRLGCRYRFRVELEQPVIRVNAVNLVAGVEQKLEILVSTGSYSSENNMVLQLRSSLGLKMRAGDGANGESSSSLSLPLPLASPFSETSVELLVKAELGNQKEGAVNEHKLIVRCPWTAEERRLTLSFVAPFLPSHKLHSVGQRKFVQVILVGNSDSSFKLSEHQLVVQSTNAQDIPLVALNPRSQSLLLDTGKSAAYMWEVGVLTAEDEQPLRLEFSVKFRGEQESGGKESEVFKYYMCLQKFKTLYELKSRVEPHKGTEFCRVGNMCSMIIEISKFYSKSAKPKPELDGAVVNSSSGNSLMYEVRADQSMWAICGRSSGIVSLEEESNGNPQEVSLDVMPMSPGYLPLPTVHLSKYIPADQKVGGGSSTVPKLEPFNIGQVYNRSKGSQVHVLPPPQSLGGGGSSIGCGSLGGSSLPLTADHF